MRGYRLHGVFKTNEKHFTDLTHVFRALIVVNRAVVTSESGSTFAFKVGEVVDAASAVLAPIWFLRAKWDFCLAVLTLQN